MAVLLPATLNEACQALEQHGAAATPMAGGTDLMVHWPQRQDDHERLYVDLSQLTELKGHRWTDEELILGAGCTYWEVLQDPRSLDELPLLVQAGRQVGAVQIQARGTWAGNIVNASPAADGVPVLMAYDAVVDLVSVGGEVSIPLADFYLGYKKMRREPHQLVRRIRIPRVRYDFQIFEKVGSRRAQAITKVGVAVTRRGDRWRVVANSAAPTVCRCPAVEALLIRGETLKVPEDLLDALDQDVAPIDDIRSTARYRRAVLARVLFFVLRGQVSASAGS